jgi:hypothetical protein
MKDVNDSDGAPTADEIHAALEHIVCSREFRRSPQLIAFLRFVVGSMLDGHPERIKSYTIGVEALGRCERFDPQADPIVRVEAARLRRALASYFAGPGARRPITIAIPLGSYVPTFCRRKSDRKIALRIAAAMRKLLTLLAPPRSKPVSRARARQMKERTIRTAPENYQKTI